MKVDFFGTEGWVGSVEWDGSHFTAHPAGLQMASVLADPVVVDERNVFAEDDPEGWMRGLHSHYKSAYFYATEAE